MPFPPSNRSQNRGAVPRFCVPFQRKKPRRSLKLPPGSGWEGKQQDWLVWLRFMGQMKLSTKRWLLPSGIKRINSPLRFFPNACPWDCSKKTGTMLMHCSSGSRDSSIRPIFPCSTLKRAHTSGVCGRNGGSAELSFSGLPLENPNGASTDFGRLMIRTDGLRLCWN